MSMATSRSSSTIRMRRRLIGSQLAQRFLKVRQDPLEFFFRHAAELGKTPFSLGVHVLARDLELLRAAIVGIDADRHLGLVHFDAFREGLLVEAAVVGHAVSLSFAYFTILPSCYNPPHGPQATHLVLLHRAPPLYP